MVKQLTTNLLLNTSDSLTTNPSDASWNIRVLMNDSGFHRIALKSVTLANIRPLFHSGNNTLVFEEDGAGTDFTATILEGTYTASELVTELKTRLDAAGDNVYTVSYDSKTFKLTIETNGTSIRILDTSTCLNEIGYRAQTSFVATSTTGDFPIRLDGTQFIDLLTNLSVDGISSNGLSNIFSRVPMNVPIGTVLSYESDELEFKQLSGDSLQSIQIRLRDDRGSAYVLPSNCQVQYTFVLST